MQAMEEPWKRGNLKQEWIPGKLSNCETQDIKVNDGTY